MLDGHFVSPFLNYFSLQQIKSIPVASFITYQAIRCFVQKTVVDGLIKPFYFMGRGAFDISGDRKTRSVCNRHDLGAFSAFCIADSTSPFRFHCSFVNFIRILLHIQTLMSSFFEIGSTSGAQIILHYLHQRPPIIVTRQKLSGAGTRKSSRAPFQAEKRLGWRKGHRPRHGFRVVLSAHASCSSC